MQCIFSVDVEDWFHILNLPSTPDLPMWDGLPSHVERDFLKLLDIFSENLFDPAEQLPRLCTRVPRFDKTASPRTSPASVFFDPLTNIM